MQTIIIDEEFKSLLPALDEKTYALLEQNLLLHGCLNPIVLWDNILIDGHNRHEICTRHDIPFGTVDKEFAAREEVLIWIISNQVSRRNLTVMQLSYYRGRHYIADRKIVTNERGRNQHSGEVGRQHDDQPQNQRTVTRLGRKYRVSPKTIERDAKVARAIDAIGEASPEAKRMILADDADISKKGLEELASKAKEEIESAAAGIEDGTYKKRPTATALPLGADGPAGPGNAEMLQLDHAISNITSDFSSAMRKLIHMGDMEKFHVALRSYIDTLEDLYKKALVPHPAYFRTMPDGALESRA